MKSGFEMKGKDLNNTDFSVYRLEKICSYTKEKKPKDRERT